MLTHVLLLEMSVCRKCHNREMTDTQCAERTFCQGLNRVPPNPSAEALTPRGCVWRQGLDGVLRPSEVSRVGPDLTSGEEGLTLPAHERPRGATAQHPTTDGTVSTCPGEERRGTGEIGLDLAICSLSPSLPTVAQ